MFTLKIKTGKISNRYVWSSVGKSYSVLGYSQILWPTENIHPLLIRKQIQLWLSKSPKIGPYQDGEVDRSIWMEGNVVLALGLELVTTLVVYGSSKTRSFSKCSFIKPSLIWTFSGNSFLCSIFFDRLTFSFNQFHYFYLFFSQGNTSFWTVFVKKWVFTFYRISALWVTCIKGYLFLPQSRMLPPKNFGFCIPLLP